VRPDYFQTMGISLLRGRGFTRADDEARQAVAIVSQNLANRMFPGQDPIGRKLQLYADEKVDGRYPDRTIVGVVANVRHLGTDGRETEGLYVPFRQLPVTYMSLVLRCEGPVGVVSSVRRELRSLDSDVAAFRIGNTLISSPIRPEAKRVMAKIASTVAKPVSRSNPELFYEPADFAIEYNLTGSTRA
jgi:putative ABC transport system permease protein